MHFAEFGSFMLLFVIGLELEPSRIWRLRRAIVGMGGLQIAVTSGVLAGLAMLFGIEGKQALVLGLILSLSSTAIVLQALTEKDLLPTAAGQSSFAVLLFQDIAVIPMLALFPILAGSPLNNQGNGGQANASLIDPLPGWVQLLVATGAVAAIIIAGRYLTSPILRIVARTGMRELFTAMSLLIVVGITVLMTSVGLSPELGTFLAGVVLANSEYRNELESDIDPFKALLLGLFFMAVGASINFDLILANPLLISGLVLGVMGCKMAVLYGLGKFFHLSVDQRLIFSVGLCQVGEFAFVLFSFSTREGILSRELTDILTVVVAFSMILTPLFMLVTEKLLLPTLRIKKEDDSASDVVPRDNPVIIAGYGHFGNTVGRFLQANHIGTTVLDINSDNVNWLRRLGLDVYYGDACRHELLEIAGAANAKLIVIAISNEKKRLELIETIKKNFPDLHILVRSTNRYDAYDLMNAGMLHIYRETLDTSLRLGVDALTLLGHNPAAASRAAQTFFVHDERTLKRLSAIQNKDEYVNVVRETIVELERVINSGRP
ncbi:cation:proton antiporter [Spirosoma spitsbergense]|uniref:cation:proton antiporter domain-containing protein n=1 Tax=Spirosoma spitsbergense TaxID=431554 RepID=UPI001FDF3C43|nr:cation:proton antiporter [Spirosoma spitsbergense]